MFHGLEGRNGGRGKWFLSVVKTKILDDNDRVPEVIFTFISIKIPEDSVPQIIIALFKTQDPDSLENRGGHMFGTRKCIFQN